MDYAMRPSIMTYDASIEGKVSPRSDHPFSPQSYQWCTGRPRCPHVQHPNYALRAYILATRVVVQAFSLS